MTDADMQLGPDEELWILKRDATGRTHGVRRIDAAHVVALHNDATTRAERTGAEPAAWGIYNCDRLVDSRTTREQAISYKHVGEEIRPLYAAPPAPEPPAEIAWRVSEEQVATIAAWEAVPDKSPYPITHKLALDLLDARAALARRSDPTPETRRRVVKPADLTPPTPVIDETRRLVKQWDNNQFMSPIWAEAEQKLRSGALVGRLRSILAEHDAVRERAASAKQTSDAAATYWETEARESRAAVRDAWVAGRDAAAGVAEAHKGAARKEREANRRLNRGMSAEARQACIDEERGEDIAAEIISTAIHALTPPAMEGRSDG